MVGSSAKLDSPDGVRSGSVTSTHDRVVADGLSPDPAEPFCGATFWPDSF
jgi:hypothetical protein